MKDRIRQIRKDANMTQEKFAKRLGLKRQTIATYETGRSEPMDNILVSICREFNINENWLRTGKGEKSKSLTKTQEISALGNEIMKLPDESYKKRFVDALRKLDEKDWENLEIIANKLLEN